MNLSIMVGILSVVLSSTMGNFSTVIASNSNGEVSCYDRGIIDGKDHPFSQRSYETCGDDYYKGFLEGCVSVEGNDRDICESATDG